MFAVDAPDPTTGLTRKQKYVIRELWSPIATDMKTYGVELFLKLFASYPPYKDLFPDFRGKTLDELKGSHHIRAHATTVMFNLGSMINNLDDPECLARQLRKLGSNHVHRKVTIEQFQKLGPLILELFKESLGVGFTSEMEAAWSQLYSVILKLVEDGMNTARKAS